MGALLATKSKGNAGRPPPAARAPGVFSDKHVADAIGRLPRMATADISDLLRRAKVQGIAALQAACEAELASRPFSFTRQQGADFDAMARAVTGMSLPEAIRYAFTEVCPANDEEIAVLRWLAEHPGGSFQDCGRHLGKGNLGLVIGHLVYHRYGCFRAFITDRNDQSSVLLRKDRSGGQVRYWLMPEAEAVFRDLGVI